MANLCACAWHVSSVYNRKSELLGASDRRPIKTGGRRDTISVCILQKKVIVHHVVIFDEYYDYSNQVSMAVSNVNRKTNISSKILPFMC